MREFKKLPLELFIGYDIEQNSRVIELDASEMVERYPSGILQLVCKRPGEETTYIAPSFEQDGGTLRWTLTSYDVEKAGQGLAIVALVDTSEESVKVLASHKIRTGIEEGLHFRDAETVDPEDSLIARVLAAVSQAHAYAQDAKKEADRAEAALDDVDDAKDQAISAIEAKGAETLDSIPSDYTALSGDVSDLKSAMDDLGYKSLSPTVKTGLYVNAGAYIHTAGNSCIAIVDLTTVDEHNSIKFNISGDFNRCRVLLSAEQAANVVDGTTGVYTDYGNTTSTVVIAYEEWKPYNSLIICPNYTSAPLATVEAVSYHEITSADVQTNLDELAKDYINYSPFVLSKGHYLIGTIIGNPVTVSSTTNNWVYSETPLYVRKGETVHCNTRANGICCIAKGATNNIENAVVAVAASNDTTTNEYTYTPDVDCYVWVSGRVNETTAYVDYSTLYDIGQQVNGESYTVKPDGTGDYTTFTGMLEALKNNNHKKTVYVYPGVYDIFEELGGSEYLATLTNPTSLNWANVNKLVPDNTTIIGVGNVVLSYEPEDNEMPSADHAFLFAALNVKDVSCTIENITIKGKNCRYAVHVENGQSEKNIDMTFKNVRINMGNGGVRNAQAVGTGLGNNAKWRFIDCDINNETNSGCFTSHTNVPLAGDSASINFESCTFTINGATETNTANIVQLISAYNPTPVSVTDYARFVSCYASGKITLVNGYDAREVTKKQLFNLTMINNICNAFFVSDTFEATEPTRVYS